MKKYTVPALIIFTLILLLVLHVGGISEYWYVHYKFLDIINHFLGGFAIGLITYWLFKNPRYIVPLGLIAGIIWELFEAYYDIAGWPLGTRNYIIDTTKDLIMDTIGATVVWLTVRRAKNINIAEKIL